MSGSVLLRMIRVSDKFAGKIEAHIFCLVTFFFFLNGAVYEIMWQTIVKLDRPQMTIWHMHIACWVTKAVCACVLNQFVTL
jgi:hypothetical protein